MLGELANGLSKLGRPDMALEAIRGIADTWTKARSLSTIAQSLTPGLLVEMRELVGAIRDEKARSNAKVALAGRLVDLDRTAEAMEVCRSIADKELRIELLSSFVRRLADLGRLTDALKVARAVEPVGIRSKLIVSLAPHLSPSLLSEAMQAAQEFFNEWDRVDVLVALSPGLANLGRLAEVLEAARAVRDQSARSRLLSAVAPFLGQGQVSEVMMAISMITDHVPRSRVLGSVARRLVELNLPADALTAVRRIDDEWSKTEVLSTLSPAGRARPT